MAMSSADRAGSRNNGRRRYRLWAACALIVAVFLWPLWGVSNLRLSAAEKALAQETDPTRRVILEFQKNYAQTREGRPAGRAEMKRLWQGMESFKAPHPEFFWMALSLLEARSGNVTDAKKALEKAKAMDPKVKFLAKGPDWSPWRKKLGLEGP